MSLTKYVKTAPSHEMHESVRFGLSSILAVSLGPKGLIHVGVKMMKSLKVAVFSLLLASPVMALEPINQEKHINAVLRQGFIADKITDHCPTMAARKLRALNELLKLKDYALAKGYTEETVRAFVESKEEKKRGRAEADAWLKKSGAVVGQADSFCQIGKDEIAKGSFIGSLLRDRS